MPSNRPLGIFGLVGWCVPPAAESKAPASARKACCLLLDSLKDTGTVRRDRNAQILMGCALLGDSCIRIGTGLFLFSEVLGIEKVADVMWGQHCQYFPTLQPVGV